MCVCVCVETAIAKQNRFKIESGLVLWILSTSADVTRRSSPTALTKKGDNQVTGNCHTCCILVPKKSFACSSCSCAGLARTMPCSRLDQQLGANSGFVYNKSTMRTVAFLSMTRWLNNAMSDIGLILPTRFPSGVCPSSCVGPEELEANEPASLFICRGLSGETTPTGLLETMRRGAMASESHWCAVPARFCKDVRIAKSAQAETATTQLSKR